MVSPAKIDVVDAIYTNATHPQFQPGYKLLDTRGVLSKREKAELRQLLGRVTAGQSISGERSFLVLTPVQLKLEYLAFVVFLPRFARYDDSGRPGCPLVHAQLVDGRAAGDAAVVFELARRAAGWRARAPAVEGDLHAYLQNTVQGDARVVVDHDSYAGLLEELPGPGEIETVLEAGLAPSEGRAPRALAVLSDRPGEVQAAVRMACVPARVRARLSWSVDMDIEDPKPAMRFGSSPNAASGRADDGESARGGGEPREYAEYLHELKKAGDVQRFAAVVADTNVQDRKSLRSVVQKARQPKSPSRPAEAVESPEEEAQRSLVQQEVLTALELLERSGRIKAQDPEPSTGRRWLVGCWRLVVAVLLAYLLWLAQPWEDGWGIPFWGEAVVPEATSVEGVSQELPEARVDEGEASAERPSAPDGPPAESAEPRPDTQEQGSTDG
jgi:hypothetical protein